MIELRYCCSYRKPGESGLPQRHVFSTPRKDVFVVLKQVTDGVKTVKIWKGASIAKTASFWSTSEKFFASDYEVGRLRKETQEILGLLS